MVEFITPECRYPGIGVRLVELNLCASESLVVSDESMSRIGGSDDSWEAAVR